MSYVVHPNSTPTSTARKHRIAGFLAGLLALTAAAPAAAAPPDQPSQDLIARGEYLATLGHCASCHTASDGQKFAGGRYMPTPFGPISTPNITPDKETGIGTWTDDQFYRVLQEGVGKDGENLYPVMPYPWFTKVTRDDVMAIKAYLFSLKPVHNPRPPSHLAFPFNIRPAISVWDTLFLREGTFKPDPAKSAEWNRGAYIVEGLAHCGECHNGRNLLGDTQMAEALQGGPIESWYAPNLTSDVRDGLGKYSDGQLYSYLTTGTAPGMGVADGPMAETIYDSLAKLKPADIHAIITYLRGLPAKPSYTSAERTAFTGPRPVGEDVFLNSCASCHQVDGKGIPGAVPALAGNGAVLANGPEDILRALLGGIEAQNSYAPMPAIGDGMSDQDIADVTNYIRQAWGNQAPPNAGPALAAHMRPITFSGMNIGPNGHCGTVVEPGLAGVINDPTSGVTSALKAMTLENVLQTADHLVEKVKAADPNAKRSDIVNSLTLAYCPIVRDNPKIPADLKVPMLDHFSERVYSEAKADGKE